MQGWAHCTNCHLILGGCCIAPPMCPIRIKGTFPSCGCAAAEALCWRKELCPNPHFPPRGHLHPITRYGSSAPCPNLGHLWRTSPPSEPARSAEAFCETPSQQWVSPLSHPVSFPSPRMLSLRVLPNKFPAPYVHLGVCFPGNMACVNLTGSMRSQATDWRWKCITLSFV